jgi:hypothetical protein
MEVMQWPLNKITPYGRNARKIPPQAIDKVAASIREFGWRQPIVVDAQGVIICDHTRLLAAQKLGLEQAPVHVADNLTPAQARAYRLLDNRSHEETDWDLELLGLEMIELQDLDIDLGFTGFDAREIDALLATDADLEERANQVPEVPSEPISRSGDLWNCRAHRVLCGDATDSDCVSRLLATARPELMVTDPPYGIEYRPAWREQAGLGKQRQIGVVQNDNRADWAAAHALFPGAVMYVWHAGVHVAEVAMGIQSVGFEQIRGEYPDLSILAISGFIMVGDMSSIALAAGATATLIKPTISCEFLNTVYRLLDPSEGWKGWMRRSKSQTAG